MPEELATHETTRNGVHQTVAVSVSVQWYQSGLVPACCLQSLEGLLEVAGRTGPVSPVPRGLQLSLFDRERSRRELGAVERCPHPQFCEWFCRVRPAVATVGGEQRRQELALIVRYSSHLHQLRCILSRRERLSHLTDAQLNLVLFLFQHNPVSDVGDTVSLAATRAFDARLVRRVVEFHLTLLVWADPTGVADTPRLEWILPPSRCVSPTSVFLLLLLLLLEEVGYGAQQRWSDFSHQFRHLAVNRSKRPRGSTSESCMTTFSVVFRLESVKIAGFFLRGGKTGRAVLLVYPQSTTASFRSHSSSKELQGRGVGVVRVYNTLLTQPL